MAILDFTPAKLDLVLYKRDDAQFQVQFLDVQVTVNATDNVVIVTVPKEQYTTWTWTQGLYDLQVTLSNGDVKTLATGTITIKGDISYE